MAGILDELTKMVTPDMINQIGGALGMDPSQVSKGLEAAAPAVLANLNHQASTAGGAEALLGSLTKAGAAGPDNPLGGLMSALGGGGGDVLGGLLGAVGGGSNDLVTSLLGQGVNAFSGSLSKSLGFDVKPMLMMAVPVVAGMVNKAIKSGNLDAAGLQQLLRTEVNDFEMNPANAETMKIVKSAVAASEQFTTLRSKFTDDEWEQIKLAPVAALYLIASASPSGFGGEAKEIAAAAAALAEQAGYGDEVSVLRNAFANGLDTAKLDALRQQAHSREEIVHYLRSAAAIIKAKAPAEAERFRTMLVEVATKAAEAAKEGGFLGFGGKLVSEAEYAAIEEIRQAIA
ncbi:MAG: DUF937 domain-containing protein [Oscillochloridaceae bacterium]|nr:DUF937 domain-containing protein [Chloroflexaceae bacterium]MDW8388824.1 DUF937 domain-containing protein [Oscillochloridaceae bacterium]